jgi:hypothetical protein
VAIDVFCHVIPPKYVTALKRKVDAGRMPPFSDFFLGEMRTPGISDMVLNRRKRPSRPQGPRNNTVCPGYRGKQY